MHIVCMLNIRSNMIPFTQVAEILHQNFQIVHHQPNLSVWLALADCLAKGRKQGVIVNWHGGRGQGQRLQSPNEITEAFFCEALALPTCKTRTKGSPWMAQKKAFLVGAISNFRTSEKGADVTREGAGDGDIGW